MKKEMIDRIKKTIGLTVMLIILVILLAFFWMGSTKKVFINSSELVRNYKDENGNIIKPIKINENERSLEIDDNVIASLEDLTKNLNVDMQESKVGTEMSYMKKFLEAEAATSYPDLRTYEEIVNDVPLKEGEVQGIIKIKRAKTDGTTDYISYVTPEEFKKYTDEKATVEEKNKALDHFTINENQELVLANWSNVYQLEENTLDGSRKEEGPKYTITTSVVNYQSIIRKYTMPFEFPLAMMLVSQNAEFSMGIVNLALDTDMIITIQDNTTKTKITTLEKYKGYERIEKTYKTSILKNGIEDKKSDIVKTTPKTDFDYQVTRVDEFENNVMNVELTYVDAWTTKMETEYTYTSEDDGEKVTGNMKNPEEGETTEESSTIKQLTSSIEILKDENTQNVKNETITDYMKKNEENMNPEKDSGLKNRLSIAIEQEITRRAQSIVQEQSANMTVEEQALELDKKKDEIRKNDTEQIKNEIYEKVKEEYYKSILTAQVNNINIEKYSAVQYEIEEKTAVQKNTYTRNPSKVESKDERFLGLIKNSTGKYEKLYNDDGTENINSLFDSKGKLVEYVKSDGKTYESLERNLLTSLALLQNLLKGNSYTTELEQTVQYLMYTFEESNLAEAELDLSVFKSEEFKYMSDTKYMTLVEYIKSWENSLLWKEDDYIKDKYLDSQNENYIAYEEGDKLNLSYGMILSYKKNNKTIYNFEKEFARYKIDVKKIKPGDLINKKICDQIFKEHIYELKREVETECNNIKINENQIDALTFIKYQYGNIGEFVEMYKKYGNTDEFRTKYVVGGYNPFLRVDGEWQLKRSNANWKLFSEGTYESGLGEILTSTNIKIIETTAKALHNYLRVNDYEYSPAEITIPTDQSKTINDIAFVQWVLYESGLQEFSGIQLKLDDFKTNKFAWQTVELDKIESGDILVYKNTIEIFSGYSEDGEIKVYSAGGTSILTEAPTISNNNKGDIVIILRPKV